jgi:hypothetical protein
VFCLSLFCLVPNVYAIAYHYVAHDPTVYAIAYHYVAHDPNVYAIAYHYVTHDPKVYAIAYYYVAHYPKDFGEVRVSTFLALCVVFCKIRKKSCKALFVLFFSFYLSLYWFTVSDNPFGIFRLFLYNF